MKIYSIRAYILLVALLISLISNGVTAVGSEQFLVFDKNAAAGEIPRRFRADQGMDVSASGQFSAEELSELLCAIPIEESKVWIIDLRQESHGFVNGQPVTWYAGQNSANLNKSAAQIHKEETALLTALAHQPTITVYELKKLADGEVAAEHPKQIKPKLVESEQQLVNNSGANYLRFYVLDHNKPDDQEVDKYVDFIKNTLKPGDWQHFHCRGGKGRSSTFIAMYDMILHAKHDTFEQIMQRQEAMGNKKFIDAPTSPEKIWKAQAAKDRYLFLQKFYNYSKDSNGYAKTSWTAWLKSHRTSK